MPIAAAVNPNVIFPDNANTTTTVVPLAMNLHRRVLTMVRFCESIPITSSILLAYTTAQVSVPVRVAMAFRHTAFTKPLERVPPMLTADGRNTQQITYVVRRLKLPGILSFNRTASSMNGTKFQGLCIYINVL